MTRFGQAAVAYAERCAWSVFPLAPGSKVPRSGSHGHLDATGHLGELDARWTEDPDANLGIATGAVSGLVVLDVDPRHGGDESLATIEAEHGPLPDTPEVLTPSGGRHFYFAHPGGRIPNSTDLWPGLDVRGDGGYVVGPPSILSRGGGYDWAVGHHPDDVPLAPAPPWLLAGLRRDGGAGTARPASAWRAFVERGAVEGTRNDSVSRLAGHLLRHGIDLCVTIALLQSWNATHCRPPLDDREVVNTVQSVARRELRRLRKVA